MFDNDVDALFNVFFSGVLPFNLPICYNINRARRRREERGKVRDKRRWGTGQIEEKTNLIHFLALLRYLE